MYRVSSFRASGWLASRERERERAAAYRGRLSFGRIFSDAQVVWPFSTAQIPMFLDLSTTRATAISLISLRFYHADGKAPFKGEQLSEQQGQ